MLFYLLDFLILFSALAASALWLRASSKRLRRIGKSEELNYADYNWIVIALNRTQILNSQAALATAITTALAGLRLILERA